MVHWGDPIAVNGQRPDWLRDDDVIQWSKHTSAWLPSFGYPAEHYVQIDYDVNINYIRLSVDHPYYVATSKGFTYWPGGNAAPEDWDEGFVLLRQGEEVHGNFIGYWDHRETIPHSDIIGYRKRTVDDETSNHMVAAPAPDIESPMFVPEEALRQKIPQPEGVIILPDMPRQPAITPECIASVVNERDSLRKRVTDLLVANNRYVEERRASENWQAAFERSQDDLATVTAERDAYRQEARDYHEREVQRFRRLLDGQATPDHLTITLSGPQGCGKTAFADWLRMGLRMWNGESPPDRVTKTRAARDAVRGKTVTINDMSAHPVAEAAE